MSTVEEPAPEAIESDIAVKNVVGEALTKMAAYTNVACERGAYNLLTARSICEKVDMLSVGSTADLKAKTEATKVLIEVLNIAQKKGLFSFEESADIYSAFSVIIVKE